MDYKGYKVLIMGLGLHGGGFESARFFLKRGAELTVTDLRDENTLMPSITKLNECERTLGASKVRYVLGRHEIDDFKNADIAVKNPGVKPDSPFLQAAKRVETDISLFLQESRARLFAVTGSKGKSTTASALHWILEKSRNGGRAYLGGNITVSPLTFLDGLQGDDDVVLELSSWQLGDLRGRKNTDGSALLKPRAAVITAIMRDHLDRYASMEDYVDDKKEIYRGQNEDDITVTGTDKYALGFYAETRARKIVCSPVQLPREKNSGWIENGFGFAKLTGFDGISGDTVCLVPQELHTPGGHNKINMLSGSLAAYALGFDAEKIYGALSAFTGIEHRLEFFHEAKEVKFYNDSTATVPEAAAACIEALSKRGPLVLVTGGVDKNLDFTPLVQAAPKAHAIVLLEGTGSDILSKLFNEKNIAFMGPFDNLDNALRCALEKSQAGGYVALSPGCASFGMFLNEFDRGSKWKEAVMRLV